jgi:DNA polymerase-3 subunit beta
MDLTVSTARLASAASDAVRLLPNRTLDPVLAGLLLVADRDGLVLGGSDRERGVRLALPATVHTEGRVLVPAKPLADTVRALDVPGVRLVIEGSRLALRTSSARFALPLLDVDVHPGVPEPPPAVGTVDGALLAEAVATVAATASRDQALPLFTGVRLRAEGDRIALLASDRYRAGIARLPWQSDSPDLDAMVPAALLAEVAKQAAAAQRVTIHADTDRFGLTWDGCAISTAVLDAGFLDESRIVTSEVDTTVVVDADALYAAARRVALYADVRGVVQLGVGDSEILLRSADQQAGEAEEAVKATVSGGRTSPRFQARFLLDSLKAFAGRSVSLAFQPGLRAAVLTCAEPTDVDLRYLVVPLRPPTDTDR